MKLLVLISMSLVILVFVSSTWGAGDLAREQRLKEQIVDMIFDGDPIELNSNDHEFLAVLTESDEVKGGVIILHGRGFHPDWQDVINPLRTGLAEKGWTTLSLQMPVLQKEAKYYDYVPLFDAAADRIDAGIEYLKAAGLKKIVLLAHSCGVHMAMRRIELRGTADIDAFVGLGMGATDYNQFMEKPFPLDRMKIPVFDLFGEDDFPAVLKMAPDRLSMLTIAGNAKSRQNRLSGANHYFTDMGEQLTESVATWLDTLGNAQ